MKPQPIWRQTAGSTNGHSPVWRPLAIACAASSSHVRVSSGAAGTRSTNGAEEDDSPARRGGTPLPRPARVLDLTREEGPESTEPPLYALHPRTRLPFRPGPTPTSRLNCHREVGLPMQSLDRRREPFALELAGQVFDNRAQIHHPIRTPAYRGIPPPQPLAKAQLPESEGYKPSPGLRAGRPQLGRAEAAGRARAADGSRALPRLEGPEPTVVPAFFRLFPLTSSLRT
jgi:hypothetical protein